VGAVLGAFAGGFIGGMFTRHVPGFERKPL